MRTRLNFQNARQKKSQGKEKKDATASRMIPPRQSRRQKNLAPEENKSIPKSISHRKRNALSRKNVDDSLQHHHQAAQTQQPQAKAQKAQSSQAVPTTTTDQIQEIYENVASAPAFSAKVAEFLRKNKISSTHRRITKKRFPRRRIIVDSPFKIFMSDLIVYNNPSGSQKAYPYILVVIDCFSRYIWTRPLKLKGGIEVANALNDIFQDFTQWPNSLITDEGHEYYNKNVRLILDRYGLHHYSIKTKMKASIAERAIQTLKKRLQIYMKTKKTKMWFDALPKITDGYNKTPHRSIGMSPSQVTSKNRALVFSRLYPDIDLKVKARLKIGNVVRVKIDKAIFEKGYTENWSSEVYLIIDVRQRAGIVWYKISDIEGNRIRGIKYYFELNLVSDDLESYKHKRYN